MRATPLVHDCVSLQSHHSQRLSLDLLLKNVLRKCAYKENLTFLPDDELNNVMIFENVKDYLLSSGKEVLRSNYAKITEYVCGSPGRSNNRGTSRRIFAILLIIEKPARIMDVIEGGIDDTDLPFCRIDSDEEECVLARKSAGELISIQSFRAWPYTQRYAFFDNQWRVQAPVFLRGRSLNSHPVHRLGNNAVFPWTDYEKAYEGNSEVVRVKIHEAHCRFGAPCGDRSFALKSLKPLGLEETQKYAEFRLEVKALLKVKPRRHLEVDLITTFEHKDRYHLLFRWAEGGNLDDLWTKKHRHPEVTHKRVCWLAQQCEGLAYGLEGIHNTKMVAEDFETIETLCNSRMSTQASESGPGASTDDSDGKDYGRHGDIKPQNILWFKQDDNQFGLGVLKLSDFGLTEFHRSLTTKVSPKNIRVTPTYSAPEREIDEKLSRPFDIWSLGCIFLEFVTWFLLGAEGLSLFNGDRLQDNAGSRDPRFAMDNFYMLVTPERGRARAEVKPSVSNWIASLQELPRCSPFLSEFLNYIQASLLSVDRENRDHAGDVSKRLKAMFHRCEEDMDYALYPGAKEFEDTKENNKRKRVADNSNHINGGSASHQGTQGHTKRTRQGRR